MAWDTLWSSNDEHNFYWAVCDQFICVVVVVFNESFFILLSSVLQHGLSVLGQRALRWLGPAQATETLPNGYKWQCFNEICQNHIHSHWRNYFLFFFLSRKSWLFFHFAMYVSGGLGPPDWKFPWQCSACTAPRSAPAGWRTEPSSSPTHRPR